MMKMKSKRMMSNFFSAIWLLVAVFVAGIAVVWSKSDECAAQNKVMARTAMWYTCVRK